MTRPIQQQHYAIGFTYKHMFHGQVIYMGEVELDDGHVEHIFAKKFFHKEINRPAAMGLSEHDSWVEQYISEDF